MIWKTENSLWWDTRPCFLVFVHLSPHLKLMTFQTRVLVSQWVTALTFDIPYLYFLFIVWGNNITVSIMTIYLPFHLFYTSCLIYSTYRLKKQPLPLIFTKHYVTLKAKKIWSREGSQNKQKEWSKVYQH